MTKFETIKTEYEKHSNAEKAAGMKKYMRDQFEYYGIPTPERKLLCRDFLKEEKKGKVVDREFQYLADEYLITMAKFLTFDDIPRIRKYVQTKPWWDTIDFICKVIGIIGEKDSRVDELMLEWAVDEDIWVRRTAIEHQLGRKELTNTELLEKILVLNFGTTEFFINKAIGWTLRDYSKTDPEWVAAFIDRYHDKMSNLSIREGSKYI